MCFCDRFRINVELSAIMAMLKQEDGHVRKSKFKRQVV